MPRADNAASSEATPRLPESATHAAVAWCGVITMLATCAVINFWMPFKESAYLALIVMACTALGIFIPDLWWQKVQRRTLLPNPQAQDLNRTLTKYVGFMGSIGFVALLYWITPEYDPGGGFYDRHYYKALRWLLPAAAVTAPFYIYWVDRRLAEPRDSLWQMGRLLTAHWQDVDARVIWQHLLGWLVKGFFLPLMFTYFCDNLDALLHYDLNRLQNFKGIFEWTFFTLYFVDVSLVSMTYLMSLKATDTHIRSTEPTAMGWISALVCYEPFWSLIGRQYLAYESGKGWDDWLNGVPVLYQVYACIILLLVFIYVWATVSFGARFSNLTHRGIITNGPYRYTKHPAYLSKNLSWWMLSMPFMLSGSWEDSLRHCLMLTGLNFVYYLRAKTEERHLSLDPTYVEYARWIDQNGVLRGLNRIPVIGTLARWRLVFRAYTPPTPIADTR
jgi:protein-S-isoprenylcysteine O-methyltransferase Ste14